MFLILYFSPFLHLFEIGLERWLNYSFVFLYVIGLSDIKAVYVFIGLRNQYSLSAEHKRKCSNVKRAVNRLLFIEYFLPNGEKIPVWKGSIDLFREEKNWCSNTSRSKPVCRLPLVEHSHLVYIFLLVDLSLSPSYL